MTAAANAQDEVREALLPERARWQLAESLASLAHWLVDSSGIEWPAGWACVRVPSLRHQYYPDRNHDLAEISLRC